MTFAPEELRSLSIFADLPDDELEWFCEKGERVELAAGLRMFERGQPASALWVVVDGVVKGFEEVGGQWLLVGTARSGDVTGMLPFSRMTHYPRHTVADEPTVALRLDVAHFREMMDVSEEVVRRLVALMSDRVRGDVRLEQQNEKMMALGRLSAGLAHELNNPATAIRRASASLAERRASFPRVVLAMAGAGLGDDAIRRLQELRNAAGGSGVEQLSALERSDLEESVSDWLEARGVRESWDVAATLVEVGVGLEQLEVLANDVPEEAVAPVMAWLGGGIESDRMIMEINAAAGRVAELVQSIKTYSHMDRSREHKPTDVRRGLDNTLTMLGHKLRTKNVQLTRAYPEDLPSIPAHEGELNQVWTNLIDNAVDAVTDGGSLSVGVRENDIWVEVEVSDDGPGIPKELEGRIFEPFFTTKEVGVGT